MIHSGWTRCLARKITERDRPGPDGARKPGRRGGVDTGERRGYIVSTLWRCASMKARLVRIGNSRGLRLPKPVIEEAGLADEVEIRVRDGAVVIRAAVRPRAGWAEAARRARQRGDDGLLDQPTSTRFDREAWEWK